MKKLKPIHHNKFGKFLEYIGCQYMRQKGSHKIYHRSDLIRPIIVPTYKQIPVFIIKNNLKLLNISTKNYLTILDNL